MTEKRPREQAYAQFLAFFPPRLLSMTLYSLIFILAMFVAIWPWGKNLNYFLRQQQTPFLAFPIFAATVVLYSYIQLQFGRGELLQKEQNHHYLSSELLLERELVFLRYGLSMLLLHTTFFLLPFSPLLILAASVSKLALQTLLAAFGLIWMSGLLFRISGLLLYRLWGSSSTLGYFLGRAFFGLFLFLVPVYLPQFSSLRVLHALYKNEALVDGKIALYTAYWLCLGAMFAMTTIMFLFAHFVGKRVKRKENEEFLTITFYNGG